MLKLPITASAGLTSVFAFFVLLVVPLTMGDGEMTWNSLRVATGLGLIGLGLLTLRGLWLRGARGELYNHVVVEGAVLLGALGTWVVLSNAYSMLVYGDIVSGRRGDPEYYIPLAGLALMVQGILTAHHSGYVEEPNDSPLSLARRIPDVRGE